MRMHCPECGEFLAVGAVYPRSAFLCHRCGHRILPPQPNAALFSCSSCGLKRRLPTKHAGVLARCSRCNTVNRVDSLYLAPATPPAPGPAQLLPQQEHGPERRAATRHTLPDISAYLGLLAGVADVRNISETGAGLAIAAPEREFHVGERLYADLLFQQQIALEHLPLVVVRNNPTLLGCRFDLSSPILQRQMRELIQRGLMVEQYQRSHVKVLFEKPEGRLQLREHDLY
ncbi:PilZ domain-containing protein [Megalodesulfovibrio paquesii]